MTINRKVSPHANFPVAHHRQSLQTPACCSPGTEQSNLKISLWLLGMIKV